MPISNSGTRIVHHFITKRPHYKQKSGIGLITQAIAGLYRRFLKREKGGTS